VVILSLLRNEVTIDRVRIKMIVFWVVAVCSIVNIDRHFRCNYCNQQQSPSTLISLMKEAVRTSETSVSFYDPTRCNISHDRDFHSTRRNRNPKSSHVKIFKGTGRLRFTLRTRTLPKTAKYVDSMKLICTEAIAQNDEKSIQ
jgi:hypothetical protein